MLIYDIIVLIRILSLLVSSFGILVQREWIRFAAYSGMGHIAYILIGVILGSYSGIQSAILYGIVYVLTTLSRWIIMGVNLMVVNVTDNFVHINNLDYNTELGSTISKNSSVYLTHIKGLGEENVGLLSILNIIIWSIAGIPPIIGFIAKLLIRREILEDNCLILAIVLVLSSVVSAYAYLRVIKVSTVDKNTSASNIIVTISKEVQFIISSFSIIRLFGIMEPVGLILYII